MRTLLATLLLAIALAINLVACSSTGRMSGEVFWIGGDVDLPKGAVLRVALSDVSFADSSAIVVAEQLIEDVDSLPQQFSFSFDSGQIEQRNDYSLSARVELDGQLLYINDTVHSVLTGGSPSRKRHRSGLDQLDRSVPRAAARLRRLLRRRPLGGDEHSFRRCRDHPLARRLRSRQSDQRDRNGR